MIDIYHPCRESDDGYRPNVGIVIKNQHGKVLWARRVSKDGWQFPQGGIEPEERLIDAAFRELNEEVGLLPEHVNLLKVSSRWLRYQLPNRINARQYLRRRTILGQKQIWFLFDFIGADADVCLTNCKKPEFDKWVWTDYQASIKEIVPFKRSVYKSALAEFAEHLDLAKK